MSWGWDIDPPWKAYEEWERWHDAPIDDENEPEDTDDEYDECE